MIIIMTIIKIIIINYVSYSHHLCRGYSHRSRKPKEGSGFSQIDLLIPPSSYQGGRREKS